MYNISHLTETDAFTMFEPSKFQCKPNSFFEVYDFKHVLYNENKPYSEVFSTINEQPYFKELNNKS